MSSVSPTVAGRVRGLASAINDDPDRNKIPLPTGEGAENCAAGSRAGARLWFGIFNAFAFAAPPRLCVGCGTRAQDVSVRERLASGVTRRQARLAIFAKSGCPAK